MPGRLGARGFAVAVACALGGARGAAADEPAAAGEPAAGDAAAAASAPAAEVPGVAGQELGVAIGAAIGGRTTPGGLLFEGVYLYQVTDTLWFEGAMGISYGGGDAECFRDRADEVVCDHDPVDGYGVRLSGGLRWFVAPRAGWQPYLRGAVGGQMSAFPEDDVRGFSIPVLVGAGVRTRVADKVAVGGGAALELGIGRFNGGVGRETLAGGSIQVGVEFGLD